jgi:hypothetical protein
MNDSELNSKLRMLRVPERDELYWEMLPRRVVARARNRPVVEAPRILFPRLARAGAVALMILLVGFGWCLASGMPRKTIHSAAHSVRSFQRELAQVPQRARALMRVDRGLHGLIEEQP